MNTNKQKESEKNRILYDNNLLALPEVSIIILNWNGWKYTIDCLESLFQINYPNYSVIVVDNDSKDNSISKIKKYCNGTIPVNSKYFSFTKSNKPISIMPISTKELFKKGKKTLEKTNIELPKKLILIENNKNYGFAGGNNIASKFVLKNLDSKYILLLNNDTIVDKNFLLEMVKVAETKNNIGSVQSKIVSIDNPKIIDAIGVSIDKWGNAFQIGYDENDNGQYKEDIEIFGACAAAALYKREMLEEIGTLDNDFFAYYEDVDLSWRAQLYGWKTYYSHKSIVYHKHSASGGKIKHYYLTRNSIFYLVKNASLKLLFRGLLMRLLKLPYYLINIRDLSGNGLPGKFIRKLRVKGELDVFKFLMKMLRKRKTIMKNKKVSQNVVEKWIK